METVSNLTSAASRAIWGDTTAKDANTTTTLTPETKGTEPVSGQLGDTSAGEPYDAGNLDSTSTERTEPTGEASVAPTSSTDRKMPLAGAATEHDNSALSADPASGSAFPRTTDSTFSDIASDPTDSTKPTSDLTSTYTAKPTSDFTSTTDTAKSTSDPLDTVKPTTDPIGGPESTLPIRSEHDTEKTGVTSMHNPTSATSSDPPTSRVEDAKAPEPTGVIAKDITQDSSAMKPVLEPEEHETEKIKESKVDADEAVSGESKKDDKPTLEEKGKGVEAPSTTGGAGIGAGGPPSGELQKESSGEGTGEQWVKSSGMAAEGGDFDATKPGAGREADRLLEQKGIKKTDAGATSDKDSGKDVGKESRESVDSAGKASHGSGKEKEGKMAHLKEKIKEKLHVHKKSDE